MFSFTGREFWEASDCCRKNGWRSFAQVFWGSGFDGAEIYCEWHNECEGKKVIF